MARHINTLQTEILDESLESAAPLANLTRPSKGWARAVREALGMTREQLGLRAGISASTVSTLERSESRRTITMESLEKLAKAMDCRVVYAIVPMEGASIEAIARKRAEAVARKRLQRVAHTMRLEDQAIEARQEKRQFTRLVESLLAGSRRLLWR